MHELISKIERLFSSQGDLPYGGEKVTELEHALQCAQLAEQEDADADMIVSAFLHDVGHLVSGELAESSLESNLDDQHEDLGYSFLRPFFSDRILDPIRLHVAAKRYLCTKDPDYLAKLSECSLKSFQDQGGVMSDAELNEFESEPNFERALQMRHYDDEAKVENLDTPDIQHYLKLTQQCIRAEPAA